MKLKKLSARFSCIFAVLAMGCGTVYAVLYENENIDSSYQSRAYSVRFFARLGLYLFLACALAFFLIYRFSYKKEKERKEEENQRPRDGKEWADSGPLFEKTVTQKCPYGEIVSGNLYAAGRNAVQWVFLFLCWIAIFLCGSFTASNQLLIAGEVLLMLTLVLFVFSVFDPGYFLRPGKGTEAAYSFEKDRLRLVRKKGERVLAKKEFAWEDLIGVKEYDKTYVLVFSTSYLSYAAALPKEGTSIEVHSFLARKMREGKR